MTVSFTITDIEEYINKIISITKATQIAVEQMEQEQKTKNYLSGNLDLICIMAEMLREKVGH